jgi:cytochrome d ubiquinol oxidase subunit II
MTMEPSHLALFWVAVIGIAILVYVILDGFDLGVGILFGAQGDAKLREEMVDSISPVWDGNETWLVVIGASLFAAFPAAYAIFLPAFYIPVLLLLFGLIFRGVAFEFRGSGRANVLWDRGFWVGSTIATFVQGAAVGAMIRGIPVVDGQYAGGAWEWFEPLPIVCGVGLVLGYALLGAGWLVLKTQGDLRDWAYRRIPWLGLGMLTVVVVAFVAALIQHDRIPTGLAGRGWGLIFPFVGLLAIFGLFAGVRQRRDAWPFLFTVVFIVAAFATLAVVFWPFMIPYAVTVGNAAAPEASLSFLFWGAGVFVLPVIGIYTATVYWLFRGKLHKPGTAADPPPFL